MNELIDRLMRVQNCYERHGRPEFFHAIERYVEATGDRWTLRFLLPKLIEIFEALAELAADRSGGAASRFRRARSR